MVFTAGLEEGVGAQERAGVSSVASTHIHGLAQEGREGLTVHRVRQCSSTVSRGVRCGLPIC